MQSARWSRVFRYVWRINGVALLLLLALAITAMAGSLLTGLFRAARHGADSRPNVAAAAAGAPELRLGSFERVAATRVLRADLRTPGSGSFSGYKSHDSTSHNVLFLDVESGKSWWLLENSDSDIETELTVSIAGKDGELPLAHLFLVAAPGREGADRLVLSDLTGRRKTTLASGDIQLDEVIAMSPLDARVLYRDAAGYHLVTVNPTDITRIGEMPLSFAPAPGS